MPLIRSELPSSIHVGRGLVARVGELLRADGHRGSRAVLFSGRSARDLYGAAAIASLRAAGYQVTSLLLPSGEGAKDLAVAARVFQELAARGVDRSAVLIGLGGGVVTDLAGYVAANYLRGVALAQVPTTLLAQVDAAVGGKCALNVAPGKNNVGAIHHPLTVVVDPDTLSSLDESRFVGGFAEAVKFGAVLSAPYLAFLERDAARLLARIPAAIDRAVRTALELKSAMLLRDLSDEGEQELLLFGHTVAGALEALLFPQAPTHGEAVAIGISFATHLAAVSGCSEPREGRRLRALLRRFGLPTVLPARVSLEQIVNAMRYDKKVREGRARFVLVHRPGWAQIHDQIDAPMVMEALRRTMAEPSAATCSTTNGFSGHPSSRVAG
jgi:3-dehydroquinate synthase